VVLGREVLTHVAPPASNAFACDAMLSEDLLTLVTIVVVVVDLGRLRLRGMKRGTAGHSGLLGIVDSPEACVSKQPALQGVARTSDDLRCRCDDGRRVLQAFWEVDSRRSGVSPTFRFLRTSDCGERRLSRTAACLTMAGEHRQVGVKFDPFNALHARYPGTNHRAHAFDDRHGIA
jgi:hypothetical protein